MEGVDDACRDLARRGVDALNLAAHYHSVESMQPRFPERLFSRYPGGCYFDPDPERFAATPIDPLPNPVDGLGDPVAEIAATAAERGLDVNAWTVCLHNSRLGAANPAYRVQSAFGDGHDHAFCPSNPEVRAYFAAVVGALADRGVAQIHLESIGFPSVLHGHGWRFGHPKRQVLTSETETVLLSQCFCDGCRAAAADRAVDLDAAREAVRGLLRDSFDDPHADPPPLDALVADRPALGDLFEFRAAVVEEFVASLAAAAGDVPLSYYAMEYGTTPEGLWPAGVRLADLDAHLDRTVALCYVRDPSVARERIEEFRDRLDCPIDAGVTLDPDVIERESHLLDLVGAVREAADDVHVYHHGLATDEQLDWIERALAA